MKRVILVLVIAVLLAGCKNCINTKPEFKFHNGDKVKRINTEEVGTVLGWDNFKTNKGSPIVYVVEFPNSNHSGGIITQRLLESQLVLVEREYVGPGYVPTKNESGDGTGYQPRSK